ncbi:hypothetical protein F5890DRAFT_279188 [Lentinula detonsa]|uniref:Uncharacterized protein n=1 Tax=Lentinula detonsa TaxID=2804962 RepID=A0AA38PWJ7_9AGAR|nr:hypothetical protein F5890DRAFT_279188 [Lentinula detonsa]
MFESGNIIKFLLVSYGGINKGRQEKAEQYFFSSIVFPARASADIEPTVCTFRPFVRMETTGGGKIHRRKSSQDDEDNMLAVNVDNLKTSTSTSNAPPSPTPTRPAPPPPPRSPLSPRTGNSPWPSSSSSHAPTIPRERSRVHSSPAPPPLMAHSRSMSISVPSPLSSPNGLGGPASAGLPPGNSSFKFGTPRAPNSASPFRTSISSPQNLGVNGHSRTRSISTPYSPPLPSPLSFSFPANSQPSPSTNPNRLSVSTSAGNTNNVDNRDQKHSQRHSRLHSRNLSIFFPRPGSLPSNTITEDGSQELEFPSTSSDIEALPIPSAGSSINFPGQRRITHSLQNGQTTPLGANFTFGGRSPSVSGPTPPLMSNGPSSSSSTSSRRGHHHKHSLSHNFFSFLEPGTGMGANSNVNVNGAEQEQELELYTQPTPTPLSPWNPISPFPKSAGVLKSASVPPTMESSKSNSYTHFPPTPTLSSSSPGSSNSELTPISSVNKFALPFTIVQFLLGSFLWVSGQQIGSLGTTGLGYWVVFDAFGVGVGAVLKGWLKGGVSALRRPYGNARIESVLQFAQSVYLMFSSVYVCKETVEHVLLSAGSAGDGHHHHQGDEDPNGLVGIQFPYVLASLAFITILFSAVVFENHKKLVEITGNRIPSIPNLVRSVFASIISVFAQRPSSHLSHPYSSTSEGSGSYQPTSVLGTVLSNPYVVFPLATCVAIWWGGVGFGLDVSHHRTFDLALAGLITLITFRVSYDASVVLGTVLLQTAPRRIHGHGQRGGVGGMGIKAGGREGRMESFLRAMKDISRHPQIIHLPAPHIWQFTPTPATFRPQLDSTKIGDKSTTKTNEHLVVTLELHVGRDLGDEDVLKLTRWAWEKVVGALTGFVVTRRDGGGMDEGEGREGVKADVTVGVVRG